MQVLFQVNLCDLQGTFAEDLLPGAGLLSAFHYPLHEHVRRRVIHTPPTVPMFRAALPEPGQWELRWAGADHFLQTAKTYPLTFTDACPIPNGVDWGPATGAVARQELQDGFFRYRNSLPVAPNGPEHRLCQTWYAECCSTWRVLRDQLPLGHFKFVELGSHGVPDGWGFGDGDRLHVFAPLEDAKVGKFDSVVTTEYAP